LNLCPPSQKRKGLGQFAYYYYYYYYYYYCSCCCCCCYWFSNVISSLIFGFGVTIVRVL